MKLIQSILLLTLLLSLGLPVQAERRYREDRDNDREYAISREEAASIVRERNGGRILDIRRKQDGYQVKSLRKGRVRVYDIDGRSGEVRK